LVVEDQAIVEIKAVENVAPVHKKQLLTYLKLADKRLGLLLNFNVAPIKSGISRIVNGLKERSLAKLPCGGAATLPCGRGSVTSPVESSRRFPSRARWQAFLAV
jgi:hypothetical protein